MAAPVDLRHSVASLARDVKSLGIDPPPGFREAFMRESRHLGRESIEDLGSTYVLECLKAKRDRPHDAT